MQLRGEEKPQGVQLDRELFGARERAWNGIAVKRCARVLVLPISLRNCVVVRHLNEDYPYYYWQSKIKLLNEQLENYGPSSAPSQQHNGSPFPPSYFFAERHQI